MGSYAPNAWGIHDMHGNTFEWCRDWYHPTLPGGDDPDLYWARGSHPRVRRGGRPWTDDGWPCRSAFRLRFEPERRYDHIGFLRSWWSGPLGKRKMQKHLAIM